MKRLIIISTLVFVFCVTSVFAADTACREGAAALRALEVARVIEPGVSAGENGVAIYSVTDERDAYLFKVGVTEFARPRESFPFFYSNGYVVRVSKASPSCIIHDVSLRASAYGDSRVDPKDNERFECSKGYAVTRAYEIAREKVTKHQTAKAAVYSFQTTGNHFLVQVALTESGVHPESGAFYLSTSFEIRLEKHSTGCTMADIKVIRKDGI
jgi:hypothetical protein